MITATQSSDAIEKLSFVPDRVPPFMERQWDASAGKNSIISLNPRLISDSRHVSRLSGRLQLKGERHQRNVYSLESNQLLKEERVVTVEDELGERGGLEWGPRRYLSSNR